MSKMQNTKSHTLFLSHKFCDDQ